MGVKQVASIESKDLALKGYKKTFRCNKTLPDTISAEVKEVKEVKQK